MSAPQSPYAFGGNTGMSGGTTMRQTPWSHMRGFLSVAHKLSPMMPWEGSDGDMTRGPTFTEYPRGKHINISPIPPSVPSASPGVAAVFGQPKQPTQGIL